MSAEDLFYSKPKWILHDICKNHKVKGYGRFNKADLVNYMLENIFEIKCSHCGEKGIEKHYVWCKSCNIGSCLSCKTKSELRSIPSNTFHCCCQYPEEYDKEGNCLIQPTTVEPWWEPEQRDEDESSSDSDDGYDKEECPICHDECELLEGCHKCGMMMCRECGEDGDAICRCYQDTDSI